jgi:queuine/archaeosine tRNA-ribosyltransferase
LVNLMREIREAILQNRFSTLKSSFLSSYTPASDAGRRADVLVRRQSRSK